MPTSGYELRKQVQIGKKRWTFCFKLHVVSELDDVLEDWAGIRFRSTVTIWPPSKLKDREEEEITKLGWYAQAKKRVAKYGYKGEWTTMPQVGRWGNFEKELGSVAERRRETRLLEKLAASPGWILTGETQDLQDEG
jgi:hypothetical protein